ncbi:MAG: hypothetical protein AAFY19_08480 [Pseudomonadota bacterium]
MSKITLTILCIVIAGIITGMYLEVPQLSGGVGAFIVLALVYSFVVAKREVALLALALREPSEDEPEDELEDDSREADVIVPEWQRHDASPVPTAPRTSMARLAAR